MEAVKRGKVRLNSKTGEKGSQRRSARLRGLQRKRTIEWRVAHKLLSCTQKTVGAGEKRQNGSAPREEKRESLEKRIPERKEKKKKE